MVDIKKTAVKAGVAFLIGGGAALITFFTTFQQTNPEYALITGLGIAALTAIVDAAKHWND